MKGKKIAISLLVVFVLCTIFFIFTEINIMSYLKLYGYGTKYLKQTTLVYFHLSEGYTVDVDDDVSIFIGRHDYIYEDVFGRKGYYEADRGGITVYYKKKEETKEDANTVAFSVTLMEAWCHWFRAYKIDGGYKIEDF